MEKITGMERCRANSVRRLTAGTISRPSSLMGMGWAPSRVSLSMSTITTAGFIRFPFNP